MKGGTFLAIEALRRLSAVGQATPLPVTVLLTSDEEVGSPSTPRLDRGGGQTASLCAGAGPGRGGWWGGDWRYAIARFNLRATGRPSHAGARLSDGRSAISEIARQVLAIESMNGADCTFSVGVIQGGQWVNCVATTCTAEALSMAKRQADLDTGVARMIGLKASGEGVSFEVTRGVTRPVWEPDAGTRSLHAHAERIAADLGFAIPPQSAGGGSDGNFTGASGIPTLDGLGVLGDGAIHW